MTSHHVVDNVVCNIDSRDIVDNVDLDVDRELIAMGVFNRHFDGIGAFDRIGSLFIAGIDGFVQGVVPVAVVIFRYGTVFTIFNTDDFVTVRRLDIHCFRMIVSVGAVVQSVFIHFDICDVGRGRNDDMMRRPVTVIVGRDKIERYAIASGIVNSVYILVKRPGSVIAQKTFQYDCTVGKRPDNNVAIRRCGMGQDDFFAVRRQKCHFAEVIRFDAIRTMRFNMSFRCRQRLSAGRDELDGRDGKIAVVLQWTFCHAIVDCRNHDLVETGRDGIERAVDQTGALCGCQLLDVDDFPVQIESEEGFFICLSGISEEIAQADIHAVSDFTVQVDHDRFRGIAALTVIDFTISITGFIGTVHQS